METIVVMGLGQLGETFALGALRHGLVVVPMRRTTARPLPWDAWEPGTPILVAVAEEALPTTVAEIPPGRRGDVILLQNELFPATWRALGLDEPTVMVPWFNKKRDTVLHKGPGTMVRGRHAALVRTLHAELGLPCQVLPDDTALRAALAGKYAFLIAVNALGLKEDRTLGAWWSERPDLVESLVADAARLGAALVDADVASRARQLAMDGVAIHHGLPTRGRTAEARLRRAFALAARLNVHLPAVLGLHPFLAR